MVYRCYDLVLSTGYSVVSVERFKLSSDYLRFVSSVRSVATHSFISYCNTSSEVYFILEDYKKRQFVMDQRY